MKRKDEKKTFVYKDNNIVIKDAEEAIKDYLSHIKRVKAKKEQENPRYLKRAEEEISKVMPNRTYRRLALKALKNNPDDVLEFLQS